MAREAAGRAAVLPTASLFALSPLSVLYSSEGRMYAFVLLWSSAVLLLALLLHGRGSSAGLVLGYGRPARPRC